MPLEFIEPKKTAVTLDAPQGIHENLSQVAVASSVCGTEQLNQDCRKLSAAVRRRQQSYLRWQAALAVFALGLMGVILAAMGLHPLLGTNAAWFVSIVGLAAGLIGIGGYLRVTRRNKEIQRLVESVIASDSTAATGALIDAVRIDDTATASQARWQLMHLAPRWTEADFESLTGEQRAGLRRVIDGMQTSQHGDASGAALGRRYSEERTAVRGALCTALGRLGNEKDLQTLRSVAHLLGGTLWARPVRDAARQAAQELEARLAERNCPRTLLRASESPQASPGELVRAASSPEATPHEQLLRPDPALPENEKSAARR